jgi:hypothetical protein
MREPRPVKIAFVIDENLGFVNQPAERRGVNDSIAIALVLGAVSRRGLGISPTA